MAIAVWEVSQVNPINYAAQRFLIAVFVLCLFGGAIVVMSFITVPDANRDAIIQLIGGVNMLAGLVVGRYFGQRSALDKPDET